MSTIEVKDTEIGRVVRVSGELAIDLASELRESFLKAFKGCADLKLDLGMVESADLSCLQVMCAAHRMCIRTGAKITLTSPISEGLLKSMKDIALYPGTCDPSLAGGCLWKGETAHE